MDEIGRLIDDGVSLREAARRTGLTYHKVRSWAVKNGKHTVASKRTNCSSCERPLSADERLQGSIHGNYQCRDCQSEYLHEYQLKKLGSSKEGYQKLFEKQGGKCAICGTEEGHRSKKGKPCRLALDHDHKTGKARGLLCNSCNRGLGRFRDSKELLASAIEYLSEVSGS